MTAQMIIFTVNDNFSKMACHIFDGLIIQFDLHAARNVYQAMKVYILDKLINI